MNVAIGIQARSDSHRLPNKVHKLVGTKPILHRILDECRRSVRYLAKNTAANYNIAILCPKSDSIASLYGSSVTVLEGDKDDVLSRYVHLQKRFDADYVVRITGDCLWIPSHLIGRHIKAALIKKLDYTTNVHYRTFKEGHDVEVLSKRLLHWIDENATSAYDREHVTTLIGPSKPFPFYDEDNRKSITHIINEVDESQIKTSIDTAEELERAKEQFERRQAVIDQAKKNGRWLQ